MSIIKSAYLELVKVLSPVRHARMIGVSLGDNCLVYRSMEWPSEPYLVTIGNNVQLTKGVAIHTHGGGNVVRRKVPDFDVFGKVVIKDWGLYWSPCPNNAGGNYWRRCNGGCRFSGYEICSRWNGSRR